MSEQWHIAYNAGNQSSISVQNAAGVRICACRYNWRVYGAWEEARDRARLIVAAPQLKAALEQAVVELKEAAKLLDTQASLPKLAEIYEMSIERHRAVLKAANGGGKADV